MGDSTWFETGEPYLMLEDFKAWIQKTVFEWKRSSLRNQLVHHLSANHFDQAVEAARSLYTMEKETLGPTNEATVATLAAFAAILLDAGQPANAEPYWRELLDRKRQTQGNEHPEVGQTLRMLARLTLRLNRPTESVEFYEQALALQLKVLGEDHKEVDTTRRELEQLTKDLALNKPTADAAAKAAKTNALLPPGTVIFAVWVRKPGEATATPLLLGDFEDAFGDKRGITIGSGANCKVVLDGPDVAPLHVHIEDKGGTRKMHIFEKVVIPDDAWEHPIPGVVETIFEAGTLVDDPIAFLTLQVGSFQVGYRELRETDAEDLVRHFQSPPPGGSVPDAPMLVSRARGPFLPRDRENSTHGRPLIGIFVADGLTARQLTTLGTALGGFRETHPYVVRIEGLQELFSGRYPVFGDVPPWVAINGASEALIGAAQSCLVMECKAEVAIETVLADVNSVIPAGSASAVRHLSHGAIRLANFKRRKDAGGAGNAAERRAE